MSKMVHESLPLRFVRNCLLLFPYILSFFIPRRRDIWVFGAWFGHRYADNTRYLFDYVSENEPDIRAVWISRERKIVEEIRKGGREAYLSGSWMGFWMCCRASVAFMTCGRRDLNVPGVARAAIVQLWHGTPLKKIGFDDKITGNPDLPAHITFLRRLWRLVFPFSGERFDIILSTSDCVNTRLMSAFGVDQCKTKITGYPRGDVILNPAETPSPVIAEITSRLNAKKIVFYVPTHRCEGRDSIDLFSGFDAGKLDDCLARHNALLLVKMHFYHRNEGSKVDSPRIHWLTEHEAPDINRILPFTDVLITDYSSVYFDYLLLDRPMLFAPFDKERYLTRDREFYDDYDAVTPGPKCMDWDEVVLALDTVFSGDDSWGDTRRKCRDKFNKFVDTENSKRVVKLARELIGWKN